MSLTTHSRNTVAINNLLSQDNFFDTSSSGEGFTLSNATVQIISDREELTLITDESGECVTSPEMHTNTEYIINVYKYKEII